MRAMVSRGLGIVVLVTLCALSAPAFAGENDLVLSRLATFDPQEFAGMTPCAQACGVVKPNQESFNALVGDLGELLAPRFMSPAETLGEAGFAFGAATSFSFIPHNADHWQTAVNDENPEGTMVMGHVQVRKGLPFSFEIAGNMAYLFGSEMFTMGADVKWALNEGFYYMPDVAVRGSVNTLLGSDELTLINAGWDISVSKDFGLGGVASLAPYVGYQQLYIIGSSRLINAYPEDPRPPQSPTPDANGNVDRTRIFSPEFVFSQHQVTSNRFFLGARLNVWILSFLLEGTLGNNVNQFTLSTGVDF